ncbi:yacO, partial [Symbiodinium sp. CCMP2456]
MARKASLSLVPGGMDERLSHAAFVEEIELANGRLRYKLITGSGPETGWVSTRLYGKDLLRRFLKVREAAAPEKQQWRE